MGFTFTMVLLFLMSPLEEAKTVSCLELFFIESVFLNVHILDLLMFSEISFARLVVRKNFMD